MDVNDLIELLEQRRDAGHGADIILVPCATGGYTSPTGVDAEGEYVYIE